MHVWSATTSYTGGDTSPTAFVLGGLFMAAVATYLLIKRLRGM